jgi:hypothetical protein
MILNIFFLIKLIRQFRGSKKKIQRRRKITEKYYFSKFKGEQLPPSCSIVDPPLILECLGNW